MLWIRWGGVKQFHFERRRVLLGQDYRKTGSLNQAFPLQLNGNEESAGKLSSLHCRLTVGDPSTVSWFFVCSVCFRELKSKKFLRCLGSIVSCAR